jgi:GT2 family glycosyltransferase
MPESPSFSIIVPAWDRPGPLAACLRALLEQDYPEDAFEIIVVDDGSEVPLRENVAEARADSRVRWVRLPVNEGPASARNQGAMHARGRYLAFTDDDCIPAPDWLKNLHEALESAPGHAVGGRLVDGCPENLWAAANQYILDAVYEYYNTDQRRSRFFATANIAMAAGHFREAGGFDRRYRTSEDRDFCARWMRAGFGLIYAPEAVVVHESAMGPGRFWVRHYRFGEGAFRFRTQHERTANGAMKLEPGGFYRRLCFAPLDAGFTVRAVGLSSLVILSQAASALGFLAAWLRAQISRGRSA